MWRSAPKISSTVTFFLRARLSSSPVRAFHKRINMHKLSMTHRSPHIYGHKLFCGIAVFQSCQIFLILFIANTEGNILTFLSTRLLYCTFLFCLWRWWNPATTPLLQVHKEQTLKSLWYCSVGLRASVPIFLLSFSAAAWRLKTQNEIWSRQLNCRWSRQQGGNKRVSLDVRKEKWWTFESFWHLIEHLYLEKHR